MARPSRFTPSTRFAAGLLAGLVLAVPVAVAGSLVGAAATRHVAQMDTPPAAAAPGAPQETPMVSVNRDAKSSRLPLPVVGNGAAAVVETNTGASTSVVSKGEVPRAVKPRSNATPKGCLSAIGGLSSSAASEELTVCVADMSLIKG